MPRFVDRFLDRPLAEVIDGDSLDSLWQQAEFIARKVEIDSETMTSRYVARIVLSDWSSVKGAPSPDVKETLKDAIRKATILIEAG